MVSRGLWQVLCSLGRNRRGLRSLNSTGLRNVSECLPQAACQPWCVNWRAEIPLLGLSSRRKNLPLTWSLQIPLPTLEMPGDHFGRQPKWTFLRDPGPPASSSSLHIFPIFICSPSWVALVTQGIRLPSSPASDRSAPAPLLPHVGFDLSLQTDSCKGQPIWCRTGEPDAEGQDQQG